MLVLSRKVGQKIMIGDNITLVVQRVGGNRVAIGVEAPDSVSIVRGELKQSPAIISAPSQVTIELASPCVV